MEVSYSILIISMLFNMIYSVLMVKFGGLKNFFDVLMKGTISHDFGLIAKIQSFAILWISSTNLLFLIRRKSYPNTV